MKIVVDENIPNSTVDYLKQIDHTIIDVRGTKNEGINDEELWEIVHQKSALLITTDKG